MLVTSTSPLILASKGCRIALPALLDCLTTYVIQEQSDWFEEELQFVRSLLRQGEHVVDIGANYGVYSLTMAKAVGADGKVLAYEPSATAASLLRKSLSLNGFIQVELLEQALSNQPGHRRLSRGSALELNALLPEGDEGASESSDLVPTTTLDLSLSERGELAISFIKIDAEGEEENILRGAIRTLKEHSPLIQFEIKAGHTLHLELIDRFSDLGYLTYRLIPGLGVLAPFSSEQPIDGYLLNLFACPPAKAKELEARDLLLTHIGVSLPTPMKGGQPLWRGLAVHTYAQELWHLWSSEPSSESEQLCHQAVAHFCASNDQQRSAGERFQNLEASYRFCQQLVVEAPSPGRLSNLARVAAAFGYRSVAVDALKCLIEDLDRGSCLNLQEPFLAPGERNESTSTLGEPNRWLLAAALENYERLRCFSSYFADNTSYRNYERISSLGYASEEINRRMTLFRRRHQVGTDTGQEPDLKTAKVVVNSRMPWDHGYFSGSSYGLEVQRELSPNWLDFAALIKGHRPPRQEEGDTFRYLELGCGMGFNLCLLAAAYPEGNFTGVDFHPDHIAHGTWLSRELGLGNLRFLEADFLDLHEHPEGLIDQCGSNTDVGFDYVAAHGIATWVSPPVQDALLGLASKVLLPGGIFYCSYNTYPGWLARSSYQMLVQLERTQNHPTTPGVALEHARRRLQAALGESSQGHPLGQALPGLAAELGSIGGLKNPSQLLSEFATEAWAPLYVAQMHQRCLEKKLTPLSAATLPELFNELAPEALRSHWQGEENPLLKAAMMDLALNRSFRRDIFTKGRLNLRAPQRQDLLGQQRLCVLPSDPNRPPSISTIFGELEAEGGLFSAIATALEPAPMSIAELGFGLGVSLDELLPPIALLLHGGRICLERGSAITAAAPHAQEVNRRLVNLMQGGAPYTSLAAPLTGAPVPFSSLEALLLEAINQGLVADTLAPLVLMGLESIGGSLLDGSGKTIEAGEKQISALLTHAEVVRNCLLPKLKTLKAI